jgi:hypothetical protein
VTDRKPDWKRRARRRWRRTCWITGDGPYAVVAHCREVSVSLHHTQENADECLRSLARSGCGGACVMDHEIVDLQVRNDRSAIPSFELHRAQTTTSNRTDDQNCVAP